VCYLTEILLVLVGILLAVTVGASVEYYRQLRRVQREYEKAKEVVGDIVLSFNRQLKREAERLEVVAYKVEAFSSKGDGALKRAEQIERQLHNLEPSISVVSEDREKVLARLHEIENKVRDAVTSQETLTKKVSDIEEQARQFPMIREKGVEAVIPIRREKALAPLTETELSVLETLALEGPKTAPEIREKIKLSREHTARLMKKVYEEGYLERDTSKIPFKYRIKKEMEKLLKKTESQI